MIVSCNLYVGFKSTNKYIMRKTLTIKLFILSMFVSISLMTEAKTVKNFKDKSLDTSVRVELLLKELTLDEKLSLMTGANSIDLPAIERLGIPSFRFKDGPNGVTNNISTCFPTGITMGSTWNTELIQELGAAIGREACDANYNVILGPTVNIHRVPIGGRNFESFGEDPFLSGKIGTAYTRGVQSEKVGVSVKHFATNNQEQNRHTINSVVDERTLREIYLPQFKRIVEESDPWTIMAAYSSLNGEFCCHNSFLLDQILKKEWKFKGFVVSDWAAVHGPDAAAKGTDVEMPGPGYFTKIKDELVKGTITESRIDENLRRILRVMFLSGLIDGIDKPVDGLNSQRNKDVALRVAEEGLVLVKNDNSVLPFDFNKLKTVAVVGPNVKAERAGGLGSSKVESEYIRTVWEALNERFGGKIQFMYDQGCDFIDMPSVDAKYFFTKDGKPGVSARYFNNMKLDGVPILERTESNIDFDWAMDSPDKSVNSDDFSAIYETTLVPPMSGTYKLGLTNNDGARLYIDGKLVIDNWNDLRLVDPKIIDFEFEKGRKYDIRVEFFEWGVTAGVRFAWDIPGADMIGDKFDRSIELAKRADAVIVVGGFSDYGEGEGADRRSIELPGFQNEFIAAIDKVNKNCAVVLINGSNVSMPWIDDVSAVIEAWYPGQEGGYAVVNALAGDINPSGKLPESFIIKIEDNPTYGIYPGDGKDAPYSEGIYVGYRYYDKHNTELLYPFGHGLSYTTFKYDNLNVINSKGIVNVSFSITNTGSRAGKEVAQVYVSDKAAVIDRPEKELRGFDKVALNAGETKQISIDIPVGDLSYFDPV